MSDHHSHSAAAAPQIDLPWQSAGGNSPVALSPLSEAHLKAGAKFETVGGWCIAVRYEHEPVAGSNAIIDVSHRPKQEIVGPNVSDQLRSVIGDDVPLRTIRSQAGTDIYRLTSTRAIAFGPLPNLIGALTATGGWASLALVGPDREKILSKLTAVDLRERTLPAGTCCLGPIFGVNTLFGRLAERFELHVAADAAEFFWEVVLDAGAEFGLKPAGTVFLKA